MISQLPSLHSLCLKELHTGGVFSEEAAEGYLLPAPCMLTQLTSLSLIAAQDSAKDLTGIALLTNLRSLHWGSWENLPWDSIKSLASLRQLTVAAWHLDHPLPVAGALTGLESLLVAGAPDEDCWGLLDSLTAVNSVTKLICMDTHDIFYPPNLTPLLSFTALQHLRINADLCYIRKDRWEKLGLMTWVTKLDIGWFSVTTIHSGVERYSLAWDCAALLKVLRAMTQLSSLELSLGFDSSPRDPDVTVVVAEMHSLSSLACLKELSIVCDFANLLPGFRPGTTELQSTLQAQLKDVLVQVTDVDV